MTVSEAQYIKDQIRDNQNNLNALPTVATYHIKRANMAVVVKVAGRNIYKTHRIFTPDGKLFLLEEA